MNASLKRKAIAAAIILIAAAVLVWLVAPARNRTERPRKDAQTMKPEAAPGGAPAVSVGESSQKKAGIVTMPLELVSHREELRAYGTVLQANDLIGMRKNFAAAKASVDRSSALLEASRKEYERVKALNADDRNVSDKVLQSAEAKWRSDEADAHEAAVSLETIKETISFQWGEVIAGWLFGYSAEFRNLINVDDLLIRITLPPDLQIAAAPRSIRVKSMNHPFVTAKLINRAQATDPRIQGMSFFYLAPARKGGLLPGMNLTASLPAGPAVKGFIIPSSSVVWRNGKAWTYVRETPDRFVRREVSTEDAIKDGYFAIGGFKAGERIVVRGAQILLSAEFQPAGREEED
ncbi:MAG: hypothetical protein M0Z67_16590 [Nitrospiraceae bacterium]|nr:hypothetical protein [Nitrospiraceae bacterium]